MDSRELGAAAKADTVRMVGWATRMRLGTREEGADQGFCADLDSEYGPGHSSRMPGASAPPDRDGASVAREVLAVVRSMLPRSEAADARIRVEIDPMAAILPAGPVGTILYGMLRRAIESRANASAHGETHHECEEIALCVRMDGPWLRLHVLDAIDAALSRGGDEALGLASATAQSLGGVVEISSVPFGPGTLLSAAIPACRLAYNNEDAA